MKQTTPDRTAYRPGIPVLIALVLIGAVWIGGAVWSFTEQTAYARHLHFAIPQLLPLVIDGLAVAMAAVAWSASLDARTAVFARFGTAIAVGGSAASNAAWAWERSTGDVATVAVGSAVPIVANIAFEVLLAEVRVEVQRWRGVPNPVKIPYPHALRVVLAMWSTFFEWRRLVLDATDMSRQFEAAKVSARTGPAGRRFGAGSMPLGPGAGTPAVGTLDGTPGAVPSSIIGTPDDGSGTPVPGTPATVPEPLPEPRFDTPVGTPSGPVDGTARNPSPVPLTRLPEPPGRNPGTGTPEPSPTSDGTPAETPADAALLRDLRKVPREADGTVPIKRAMKVLGVGRPRAIHLLRVAGLLREPVPPEGSDPPDDTPDGTGSDDDQERRPEPLNGHRLVGSGVSA